MNRKLRGLNNYHDGLSAERGVARRYERAGGQVAARRWRGPSGEIDLVIRQGAEIIFVEVKKARDFARAAEHLTMRQLARIIATADEYIGSEPDGQLTQVRVDVALVNQAGETVVYENVTV